MTATANITKEMKNVKGSAILGIDGMIDEVWELIDSRSDAKNMTKIPNMKSFGDIIVERGTGGLAKERVLKRRSCGGFVCNTGRAVGTLGIDTTFLGFFGKEPYAELFDEFKEIATLVSLGNAANIHILEFLDGKIMMPNLEAIINLTWADVINVLSEERVKELFDKDIVGLGYWSNMFDFETILERITDLAVANKRTKRVFHDFANLNKRTPEALKVGLAALKKENARLPQTLSLNEHEGGILAEVLGVDYPEDVNNPKSVGAVEEAVKKMQNILSIDEVVVHTLYYSVGANVEGVVSAMQTYCENPAKTTGAGDTFNGGYMASCLGNLSLQERLIFANASTLYYVSTGSAGRIDEVLSKITEQ
ncbi:MAG: PfkB family carbohydrate kinase [Bacillota bacterium]